MAKMKNKKNKSSRSAEQDFGANEFENGAEMGGAEADQEESAESNYQAAGSRQMRQTDQIGGQSSSSPSDRASQDFDPRQLLDSAREFVEGHPGRATLIGAAIGGVIAGLFATERGRQLARAAYSYSRPMIADYARNFINSQGGDVVERALPQ